MRLTEEDIALVTCFYAAAESGSCAPINVCGLLPAMGQVLAAVMAVPDGRTPADLLTWTKREVMTGRLGFGLAKGKCGEVGASEAAAA